MTGLMLENVRVLEPGVGVCRGSVLVDRGVVTEDLPGADVQRIDGRSGLGATRET